MTLFFVSRISRCTAVVFLAAAALWAPAARAGGFPYDAWGRILERVVDERGFVDYGTLALDREELNEIVAAIAARSPENDPDAYPSRDAALAYYLNAYNALVFRAVLDLGPEATTVWGKSGSGLGFFVRRKVEVGGRKLSLKKLEDDLVRAAFRDPRIHAALNCASVGCPRLPQMPFSPDRLDAELDAAMRELVASEAHVRYDRASGTVTLSKIFDWFRKDFLDFERENGSTKPQLLDYVNRYREEGSEIPESARVEFSKYDKRLNRQGA